MKSKILMLLSFLLLIGSEATAQLTRLSADEVTEGKRIFIRKIRNTNRDLWTTTADLSVKEGDSYVFVVENADEEGKIKLKREVDGLYMGANGGSIKMVNNAGDAVSFRVIKPVFGGSGDEELLLTDEPALPSDMSKEQIVRFFVDGTNNCLNVNTNNYASGKGIWSACEVLQITGEPTQGKALPVGDGVSPVYVMWKSNDGKVLTGTGSVRQQSVFNATDYVADNTMQQWQTVDAGNGKIRIYNVGSGLYLGRLYQSAAVLGWNYDKLGYLYEASKVGTNDVFVCIDDIGNDQYLHCNNGNLVGWYKGEATGSNASQWRLVELTDVDKVQANFALRDEFTKIYNDAFGFGLSVAGLIRSADQLYTPYQEKLEGPIENLIDDNTDTFFHSNWSTADPEGTEFHYFDVKLDGNDKKFTKFRVRYAARNGNNRPTEIKVYGQKGDAWEAEPFCTLTDKDGLGDAQGEFEFDANGEVYDALRFAVTKTNATDDSLFFTYSEFQLYGLDDTTQKAWEDLNNFVPGVTLDYVDVNFADELSKAKEIAENLNKYFGAVDVTYECVVNEQTTPFFTITTTILKGEAYPAAPDFTDRLLTLSNAPTGSVEKNETITLKYTYDNSPIVPTTIENGKFAENTVWYTVHLPANANGKPNMMLNGSGDTFAGSTFEQVYDESAWFCFVGDPGNGFQVYSKKYGVEKPLNRTDNAPSVNGNIETKWLVFKNGDNFTVRDYTDTGKWWNQIGGYNAIDFGFYSGGSPIQFLDTYQTAENMVDHSVMARKDGYVGGFSNETVAAIKDEAKKNGVTKEFREELRTLMNNSEQPVAGKYYRITNVGRENQITLGYSDDGHARGFELSKSAVGQVYEFVPVPDENGYRLKNLNTGKFVSALAAEGDATLEEQDMAALFRLNYLGEGQNNIVDGNGSVMHCAQRSGNWQLMSYGGDLGSASAWYITEATELEVELTTTDDEYSYTTVYLPFAVKTPEGTAAYTAKRDAENEPGSILIPVRLNDNVVPACEGVVLKNNDNNGTVTLSIVTTDKEKSTDNVLTGTLLPDSATDCYTFNNADETGLGFYPTENETLDANKAFIRSTGEEPYFVLDFEHAVVGIDSVKVADKSAPLYDLFGRRVEKAVKGIYISGGKKIYVK